MKPDELRVVALIRLTVKSSTFSTRRTFPTAVLSVRVMDEEPGLGVLWYGGLSRVYGAAGQLRAAGQDIRLSDLSTPQSGNSCLGPPSWVKSSCMSLCNKQRWPGSDLRLKESKPVERTTESSGLAEGRRSKLFPVFPVCVRRHG